MPGSSLTSCSVQMESPPQVIAAASVLKDLCYKNKDELQAGFLTAGWDKKNGPQVADQCEVMSTDDDNESTLLCVTAPSPSLFRCMWCLWAGC